MLPLVALLVTTLPDIDEPLRTGARADRDTAVVVGVEDYFKLPDVPYAARDARAFESWLVYTRGVPADRVTLLADAPNREQILEAVERAAAVTPADGILWLYFAGHGAAAPDDGQRLLLGADAQPDLASFKARAVATEELTRLAARGGAQVVMVTDACYTGRGRAGQELISGKRFTAPVRRTPAPKVIEWSAASDNQWSGPLDAVQHGAFTYLLVGALRGWADGERDGKRDGAVTLEEAQLYLEASLRTLQLHDQRPALQAADRGFAPARGVREPGPPSDALRTVRVAAAVPPAAAARPVPASADTATDALPALAHRAGLVTSAGVIWLLERGQPPLRGPGRVDAVPTVTATPATGPMPSWVLEGGTADPTRAVTFVGVGSASVPDPKLAMVLALVRAQLEVAKLGVIAAAAGPKGAIRAGAGENSPLGLVIAARRAPLRSSEPAYWRHEDGTAFARATVARDRAMAAPMSLDAAAQQLLTPGLLASLAPDAARCASLRSLSQGLAAEYVGELQEGDRWLQWDGVLSGSFVAVTLWFRRGETTEREVTLVYDLAALLDAGVCRTVLEGD